MMALQENSVHSGRPQDKLVEDNLDVLDVLIIKKEMLVLEGVDNTLVMVQTKFLLEMVHLKDSVPLVLEIQLQIVLEELVFNAQVDKQYNKYTTPKLDNMKINAKLNIVNQQDHSLMHKVCVLHVKTINDHQLLDHSYNTVPFQFAQVKLSFVIAHANHALLVQPQMPNKEIAYKVHVQTINVVIHRQVDNAEVIHATKANNWLEMELVKEHVSHVTKANNQHTTIKDANKLHVEQTNQEISMESARLSHVQSIPEDNLMANVDQMYVVLMREM